MFLRTFLLILALIGIFNNYCSYITSISENREYKYVFVLESISILKIKASIPSSSFCEKCGSRFYRTKCPCSSIGNPRENPGPSSQMDESPPRRKSSKSKRSSSKKSKRVATTGTTTHHPLSKLTDRALILRLISDKSTEIKHFKSSINDIKASIDALLTALIADCALIFTRQFSDSDSDELKEELLEILSGFAGLKFLEVHLPFLLKKEKLNRKVGGKGLTVDYLETLLESCLAQSYTIINNLASMYDKKNKIKEIKEEIQILKSIHE